MKLKNRLRVLRAEKEISQKDLAEEVGLSRQTVNSIERGKFNPSIITALKIADYFAFGPAYLKELRILVAEGEQGIIKSTEVSGNIGNGLLQNFSIILNYPEKNIYILPLENE